MSKHHRFVGAARRIAALTLASRVLGLLREMVYGHFFGASPLFSAFRIGFQLPNLARRLFGEGALTSSFIPVFARSRADDGDEAAERLTGGVLTFACSVLLALLVVGELVLFVISRFTPSPTLVLAAVMLPYMPLICLTAFFGGVLQSCNRFTSPALAPLVFNVVVMLTAWFGGAILGLSPYAHLIVVAVSVLVAGGLQLGMQVAWVRGIGFKVRVNFDWAGSGVRRVTKMMAPMIIGLSAVQINTFCDFLIAFFFVPDGRGPAVLGFSQYLYNLPLGIFGTALATAIFPMLAHAHATNDRSGLARAIEYGMRTALFITIPAGVGLILIAGPLVRTLFQHGAFTPSDTSRVASSLSYYGLGIWAYSMQHILVRSFYSMEDSRTPVRIAMSMVLFNLVLNLLLVGPMRESGVALATAITAFLQTALLATALTRRLPQLQWRSTITTAVQSVAATTAMGAAVWWLMNGSTSRALLSERETVVLVAAIAAGGLIYIAITRALSMEELGIILRSERASAAQED